MLLRHFSLMYNICSSCGQDYPSHAHITSSIHCLKQHIFQFTGITGQQIQTLGLQLRPMHNINFPPSPSILNILQHPTLQRNIKPIPTKHYSTITPTLTNIDQQPWNIFGIQTRDSPLPFSIQQKDELLVARRTWSSNRPSYKKLSMN